MTARTSEKLAQVLHAAGLFELERRARKDEFHDFLSSHALPELELDAELLKVMRLSENATQRQQAEMIRQRLHDGDFDADLAESEDWAKSEDGQDAFRRLGRGE